MVTDDRLRWLLGEERPVWALPMGFLTDHLALAEAVGDDEHVSLRDLEPRAGGHPEEVAGLENRTLRHVDDAGHEHHVVVTAGDASALEAHLDSVSVWLRAVEDAPQPVFLADPVAAALEEVTGASIADLLAGHSGGMPTLAELAGPGAPDGGYGAPEVAAVAAALLEEELDALVAGGDITPDDRDALDAAELIAALLGEPASDFAADDPPAAALHADPGHVATWLGPAADEHGQLYSLLDIGTIKQGRSKTFTTKGPRGMRKILVRGGRVDVTGAMACVSVRKDHSCQKVLVANKKVTVTADQDSSIQKIGFNPPPSRPPRGRGPSSGRRGRGG